MRSGTFPSRVLGPLAALILSPFFLTGCGSSTPPGIPVSGKISLGDKPLTTGTVTFKPDRDQGNKLKAEPHGEIKEDGTYALETDGKPGAPPGAYKVTVYAAEASKDPKNMYAVPVMLVHKKFGDEKGTPLKATVAPDAPPGTYDFKVTK
jgi:hypothetical protein